MSGVATSAVRRQLSLFVPHRAAAPIDAVRRLVDPVQHGLIPAHVTLCREDEIGGLRLPELERRLAGGTCKPITLRFGRVERFCGHGLLWRCSFGEPDFRALRERVLGRTEIRRAEPHITLAHPRNPLAPGNSLVASLPEETEISFDGVHWIEQEGRLPWRVLRHFRLD